MKHRSDELVRFISRAFGAATVAIVVGAGVFLTLSYLRAADDDQARRSHEGTRLAREATVAALERHSAVRAYLNGGGSTPPARLAATDAHAAALLDSLRRLTAAEPIQRAGAARISAAFARWDSTIVRAAAAGSSSRSNPGALGTALNAADAAFSALVSELNGFLAAEQRLAREESSAAHRLDRVITLSAIASLLIMLVTLYLLRRRLLAQARDVSITAAALDLRNAQLIDQTQQMERMIDALQASEVRFRTLVDSLPDVVFTLGHEKRFTGMFGVPTPSAGATLDQFIGMTATEILGPEAGQVHVDAADRALNGETVKYDWTTGEGAEQRFYSVTVSPLRGPGGEIRGVVGLNRDVTDQVIGERALSEAREQLRQAQRLDALGQLAGGVAHDFNNLLTVIMTYAAILQEEADPGSDEWRSTEEIRTASERAAALTRQLLAFSRRQVLKPRPVDLNETVREVERMLRRLLPPQITLETQLDPALGKAMADPGQIEQVLVNLAINARDAMPDGGRLTISTANVPDGNARSRDAGMTGPHVLVEVSDTGVGMPPETAAKVFEPFFTTKGLGQGTGLGLATVHGIIEQSGGRISLDTTPGRGTRFQIRLPMLVDEESVSSEPALRGVDLRGSETILLVDDNDELRRVVKRMLTRAGYAVLEAANGTAALAHLDRGASVDVVISDVMMPEMNGKALLDALRKRHRDVRVLLMSGYNFDTALRGMAQRGDVAFIEKPFTAEGLLQKLRDVLGLPLASGAA